MKIRFVFILLPILIFTGCSKKHLNGSQPAYQAVLSEQTINMDEELVTHISDYDAENKVLYFDSSLSAGMIPEPGEILYSGQISSQLPSGFAGKVTDVIQDSGQYRVQCETVPLDEVFDRLYINQYVDLQLVDTDGNASDTKAYPPLPSRVPVITPYKDNEGFMGYNYGMNMDYSMISYGGASSALKLSNTVAARMLCMIDIQKGRDPFISFTLTVKNINEFYWKFETARKEPVKMVDWELGSWGLSPVALPYGALIKVVLDPKIVLSLAVEANAKMSVEQEVKIEDGFVLGIEYKNGELNGNVRELPTNGFWSNSTLTVNGTLFAGFKLAYQVSLLDEKTFNCEAAISIGPEISAELSVDDAEITYENVKNSKVEISDFTLGADISGRYAKSDLIGISLPKIKAGTSEYYCFPVFSAPTVTVNRNTASAEISSVASRELVSDSNVGIAVYSGDELVYQSDSYLLAKDAGQCYMNEVFSGLMEGISYTACPYVLYDGRMVRAYPEVNFTLESGPDEPYDPTVDPDEPVYGGDPIPFTGRWKVSKRYADGKDFDWPYDEVYEFYSDGLFRWIYYGPNSTDVYEYYLVYDSKTGTLTHADDPEYSAHVDYFSGSELRLSYTNFKISSFGGALVNTVVLR